MSGFKHVRKATSDDLRFILELEAKPENTYVHAYDAETHTSNLEDPNIHYWIAEDTSGKAVGFAILFSNEQGRFEWRRIIMAEPGNGAGKPFMIAILDELRRIGAVSIWLDVYPENDRARHVYGSLGFKETGTEPNPKEPSKLLIVMELIF